MANNQVTVRFEGTTETNQNDRLSYIKVTPFKQISYADAYNFINGSNNLYQDVYIFDEKLQKYTRIFNIKDDGTSYYIRDYKFKNNLQYYVREIENEEEIYKPVDVFDNAGNEDFDNTKDYFILNETQLVSGPVEIFATIDVLREEIKDTNGKISYIAHPTLDEMNDDRYKKLSTEDYEDAEIGEFSIEKYTKLTGNNIALESPYVSRLVFNYVQIYEKTPVIFVESVMAYPNNQDNRGAYFKAQDVDYDVSTKEYRVQWQEILLGTHSHSNPRLLENISNMDFSSINNDAAIYVDKYGNFKVKEKDEENKLSIPDLPKELVSRINELNKYKDLYEPTEDEKHHLDAKFSELENTYDWMTQDENGNYINLALGSCRDLYRELLKKDKKLFLSKDFSLEETDGLGWISLDAFKLNYDYTKKLSDAINVELYPSNLEYLIFNVILQWNNTELDEIFLFNDGIILNDSSYNIIEKSGNKLTILLNKKDFKYEEPKTLTILVLHDVDKSLKELRMDVYNAFNDGKVNLFDINNYLAKLFVESEFTRRPTVPRLYLTTDEYGTLVWDNKLLPSQTFYANSQTILITEDSRVQNVKFRDVSFSRIKDFPLLLVNNYFVPNAEYIVPEDDETSVNILFDSETIPFLNLGDTATITLIVIKNSSAGSISDEIAKNYVSKKDAISILSHGKINLKDYATYTDLLKYSKIGHTHNEYAKIHHNHDERYAMYHHTHPELIAIVTKLLSKENISEDEINNWVEKIISGNEKQLIKFLLQFGRADVKKDEEGNPIKDSDGDFVYDMSTYEIIDSKIIIENVDYINEKIDRVNEELHEIKIKQGKDVDIKDDIPKLNPGCTLEDILQKIVLLFEVDSVKDSQVYLESPISVKLVNGPIGGLTEEKTYTTGTNLQDILRDILSPYLNVKEMIRRLTPVAQYTKINWFKTSSPDGENLEYVLIGDPGKIPLGDSGEKLYFTVTLKNADNKDCIQEIVHEGKKLILRTIPIISVCEQPITEEYTEGAVPTFKVVEKNEKGYYLYSDAFDLANKVAKNEIYSIKVEWLCKNNEELNDKVYDNYGNESSRLNSILKDDGSFEILKNFEIIPNIQIDLPNFYWTTKDNNEIPRSSSEISEMSRNTLMGINTQDERFIILLVRDEVYEDPNKVFDIVDPKTHNTVLDCFEDYPETPTIQLYEEPYVPIYYESLDETSKFELLIKTGRYECSDWRESMENKYQVLFKGFKRLRDFPLDPSCIYTTYVEAERYLEANRTAYLGQVVAVYDDGDKTGLYIIINKEGKKSYYRLASNEELVKTIVNVKELISSLDSEVEKKLNETIDNVNTLLSDQKTELTKLVTDKATELENKFENKLEEDKNLLTQKIQDSEASLNEKIEKEIAELEERVRDLGFDTDALDSFKEISEWVKEHKDQLDKLTAGYTEEINKINGRVEIIETNVADLQTRITAAETNITNLGVDIQTSNEKIKALQDAGYLTEEDVRKLIGTEDLQNVMKVMNFKIQSLPDAYVYAVNSPVIPEGYVLQDLRIDVISPMQQTQKAFSIEYVSFDDPNTVIAKLIPNEEDEGYYATNPYGDDSVASLIDFSVKGSNSYNLNYEVPVKGHLKFSITRDITVEDSTTANIYLNYFKK